MRLGSAANDDSPTALHKLTGSLLWGLLLVLLCLGSASSDANTPPPGQLVASFVYNPSGLRIEKQGERGVERFTYDEQSLLQAYDENNTTLAKYDYGAERLVSLTSSSEPVQFYLTDALNSVVNLTNTTGSVQARYQYDAFGNQRAQSGSSYNRFAFTGYVEDKETDLLYAKARYYDSDTGRFLSQDAWEGRNDLPPSLHKYLYAYQNPTVYVDPDGNVVLPALAAYFLYTAVQTAFDVGVDRGIAELTNDEEFSYTKSIATNFGINAATAGVGGKLKNAGKVGKLAAETAIDAGVTTAYEVGAEGKDAGSTLVENTASGIAGRIVGDKIAKRFSGSSHLDSTAEPSLKTAQPKSEAIVTRESDAGPLTRNEESVRVGEGEVTNKLPQGYYDDLALQATKNPESNKVVLGKFLEDGKSYTKVGAHYEASYFKLDNWRELDNSLDDMWPINEAFLDQQVRAGKEIILSHDPEKATGYFKREVNYLQDLGFKFEQDNWVWKAKMNE